MRTRHFAQIVALSALWGASFLFIRIAAPVFGPFVMSQLRVVLASVVLLVLLRAAGQRLRLAWWPELMALSAMTVALPFMLFGWSGLYLPAGYSALLNTTAVVFGALSAAALREDTLDARKALGCVCGFGGVALVVQLGPVQLTPTVLLAALACIAGAACHGACMPWMKRATRRISPLVIAAGCHMGAVVLMLPPALAELPAARFTWAAAGAVLVMGVLTSGLAYWLHVRIIQQVTPVAAMAPMFLIPIFGVAWGAIFLGEPLGPGIWAGGALVLLAAALVTGFNPVQRWRAGRPARPGHDARP